MLPGRDAGAAAIRFGPRKDCFRFLSACPIGGAGATGTLVINGNYSQGSSGALDMALANTSAIDQLMIKAG
jgi:hypothetical protein